MKFGKVLQQSQQVSSAAWEPNWVDYKLLKRIIKDCAQIQKEEKLEGSKLIKTKIKPHAKEDNDSIRTSPDEENFFRTLRSEIKKIGDFFLKEQAAYISRVKEIEGVFLQLQTAPQAETKTDLMQRCVALYKELLLLENFAVMNFCGISKILKKHDKWTGYATRNKFMRTILMKQPFATYLPLLQMIDRLEHIFMDATGNSIDQHHSRRRGSGGSGGAGATGGNGSPHTPSSPHPTTHSNSTSNSTSSSGGSTSSYHHTTHTHPTLTPSRNVMTSKSSPPRSGSGDPGDDSPAVEGGAVTLGRVHALRDDALHFRETEGVDDSYDGDDSADSGDDVTTTMRGLGSPPSDSDKKTVVPAATSEKLPPMAMRHSMEPTSTATATPLPKITGLQKDYNSDSDAAAIAMLSMKEAGMGVGAAGAAGSAGFRSGSDSEGSARFKRKACSPLPPTTGKRKMSFATILN